MLSSSIYQILLSFIITFFFNSSLALSTFVTDYEINLLDRLIEAVNDLDKPALKNTEQSQLIRKIAETVQVDESKSKDFSQAVESTVNNASDDFFDENITRTYFNFLSHLPSKHMDDFASFYFIVTVKLNSDKHQNSSITYLNAFLEKMPETKKELVTEQLLSLVKIFGYYPVSSIIPERFHDPNFSANNMFAIFSLSYESISKDSTKNVENNPKNWRKFKKSMQNTKM